MNEPHTSAERLARFWFREPAGAGREPMRFSVWRLFEITTIVAAVAGIIGQLGPGRSGAAIAGVLVATVVTRQTLRKAVFISGGDQLSPARAATGASMVVTSWLVSLYYAWMVGMQLGVGFDLPEGGWLITLVLATLCLTGPMCMMQIGVVFMGGLMWLVSFVLIQLIEPWITARKLPDPAAALASLLALILCTAQIVLVIVTPDWLLGISPTGYWRVQLAAIPLVLFGPFLAREIIARRRTQFGLCFSSEEAVAKALAHQKYMVASTQEDELVDWEMIESSAHESVYE